MHCYRLHLRQTSGGTTLWHSDTLWGQLCWIYRDLNGEEALKRLIQKTREGNVPFVCSDGFPTGFLPVPTGGISLFSPSATQTKMQGIMRIESGKLLKCLRYISESNFAQVIQGHPLSLENITLPPKNTVAIHTHNTIARDNNTALDGNLYQELWQMTGNGDLDVYVLVREDFADTLWNCFAVMEVQGFGGNLSIGLGAFETIERTPFAFPAVSEPNSFVTLSHCTPSPEMHVNGQYTLRIKYGKLGHERSQQGDPFKKPVIQVEPGAVFCGPPAATGYCGCLVEGVAFNYPDVVQCGLSITVPARIQESS